MTSYKRSHACNRAVPDAVRIESRRTPASRAVHHGQRFLNFQREAASVETLTLSYRPVCPTLLATLLPRVPRCHYAQVARGRTCIPNQPRRP
jgi:hypothetical protein